jgi:DNA-directed RNA polymerase I subunit RPA2
MKAEIFIGIVHYQRLRHMVKDKFQVRSTGPVNSIHRQPVKGRKKGGGIRFGEMERDSLLAHGCSFLLHDRLMGSSDYHTTHVCTSCGSLLNVVSNKYGDFSDDTKTNWAYCKMCKTGETCSEVAVPYVFLYLVNELAAMNIRTTLDVK